MNIMERDIIVEHLRKKRKIVIITFILLITAFLENHYLSCIKTYSPPWCEIGWIYIVLAAIVFLVAFSYRK